MGHLAAYLSHDEGDRDGQGADRKNQHGFRILQGNIFREKVNEGGIGNAHGLQPEQQTQTKTTNADIVHMLEAPPDAAVLYYNCPRRVLRPLRDLHVLRPLRNLRH